MNAMVFNQLDFQQKIKWLIFSSLILLLLAMMPYIQLLASECGSFVSELLLERSGIASSTLTLERSGVGDSSYDLGMGAVVTTNSATNVAATSATLNGNLSTFNGAPLAIVYFEWGYDLAYGNTVGTQTVTATGAFSANLSGFYPNSTIYYRAVSETDGIYYASGESFEVAGGTETGTSYLGTMLPIAVAGGILMFALRKAKNPMTVLVGIVIGLIAFFVVQQLVEIFF